MPFCGKQNYLNIFQTAPEIPTYLYLLAPISLVILNPIGLILMEIGKVRSSNETISEQPETISERFANATGDDHQTNSVIKLFNIKNRNYKTCIEIIKGVITNPLIFMTVLGVLCGTFVFDGKGNHLNYYFSFSILFFYLIFKKLFIIKYL